MSVIPDRCFLRVNFGAFNPFRFLNYSQRGVIHLWNWWKSCKVEDIQEMRSKLWVLTHGLRRSTATMLFMHSRSESSVAIRKGHRDLKSLERNQRLRDKTGLEQPCALVTVENRLATSVHIDLTQKGKQGCKQDFKESTTVKGSLYEFSPFPSVSSIPTKLASQSSILSIHNDSTQKTKHDISQDSKKSVQKCKQDCNQASRESIKESKQNCNPDIK